jgi:alpha-amylase/alpha-mannosidase (GH57 family)
MKFLCIHGHFYQPPRENPWTGAIDPQESALPFHDWNERITSECYAANAEPGAKAVPPEDVAPLPANYSKMSFDFGPTLLSWLEVQAPDVYRAILQADRDSRGRFSGHGSALAQAFNHMILPLANRRDKRTQVIWGIRDFEHRFGRSPEGMWLPETAVDRETLEILAGESIRFTVLSPHQVWRWRRAGEPDWRDGSREAVDLRRPYEVRLPKGQRLALFFYDGPASHAVAFGELAQGSAALVRRLSDRFSADETDELVSIATDGETYGHHHRGGHRVLAEMLDAIERAGSPRLTNYGEYLASHPPADQVEILENTSWSCAHGLGRWSESCGCVTGEHPKWTQAWRAPLRAALDWLRDRLGELYESRAGALLADPWAARDDSIEIWLDRDPDVRRSFLARHARRSLDPAEQALAVDLLDLQRQAMLMYTSCGWFFDDVGGLEGRQILQYAGRAIEIAARSLGVSLLEPFLDRVELAQSNVAERGDARRIFERDVLPWIEQPGTGKQEG